MTKTPPDFISNIDNTEVRPSNIHGFGLFATDNIKNGTLLCELGGQLMTVEEYHRFLNGETYSIYSFIEKSNTPSGNILARPFRTSYGFINHHPEHCDIVTEFCDTKSVVKVYANRDIPSGDEILDEYNLERHLDVLRGFS